MIARFFRWLFGRQVAPPAAPAPPPERESMSFFSTDVGSERGLSTANEKMLALLGDAMRPRSPMRVLREVAQDGEGAPTFALDAMADPGIKAEFLVGQTGIPEGQAGWFISQGFIGYQLCALIAQHWLVQRACVMPARDAIRKGYEFKSTSDTPLTPEIVKAITKANKRYKLDANLVQFVKFQRVFGIRVAMFKIESDDPDFYVKPFNPDGIRPGSYRGISQIDPYWIVPELTSVAAMDPASIDFYEPTYWIVGSQRIHKSHLVIIRGPEVADILKPAYLYGGLSIPQQIAERVYAAERTANEAPQLALSKRATIFYTDAAKAMGNEEQFVEKVSWWSRLRDNFGIKVADKDDDKIEQIDTSLADLDSVIMTQFQLVAAIAETPATKLLGTTPKGFNATGDYETDSYHETLESVQVNDMEPLIERHMLCMIRSEIAPIFGDGKPFGVDVVWRPLSTLNAVEQSAKNKTDAETDQILVGVGAVTGAEVRERLSKDETSGFTGIPTIEPGAPDNGDNVEKDAPPADGQA